MLHNVEFKWKWRWKNWFNFFLKIKCIDYRQFRGKNDFCRMKIIFSSAQCKWDNFRRKRRWYTGFLPGFELNLKIFYTQNPYKLRKTRLYFHYEPKLARMAIFAIDIVTKISNVNRFTLRVNQRRLKLKWRINFFAIVKIFPFLLTMSQIYEEFNALRSIGVHWDQEMLTHVWCAHT